MEKKIMHVKTGMCVLDAVLIKKVLARTAVFLF